MAGIRGKRIAILATDGFEQSELVEPRRRLEEAGASVDVVSPQRGAIRGWSDGDWGERVDVDVDLGEADASDYDGLLLPGGVINPDKLRLQPEAIDFIRRFDGGDKPIAAICHGPWTLIDAGLVEGRRVTSWPSLRKDLENAGAQWLDEEVVRDARLITSRKPDDIPAFSKALIEAFG